MPDVQEVFRMATQKIRPDPGFVDRQFDHQRRTARNRRMGAITLVAALVLGVIAFATVLRPGGDTKSVPGEDGGQTPAPRTPPFGAQIIGMDGRVIERIPAASDGYGLRLSPDGTTIAFITPGTVSAVGVDDTGPTTLIQGIANNQGDAQDAVSWSPDGSEIAYVDDGDIYVMNADGSNTRRLTTDPKGDFYPAWSPDGSTIAYWNGSTSGVDGGPEDSEIYTIPAGGGTPTRLTRNDLSNIEPAWSPNGTQIAYWNGGELWVMRADGSEQHRVYEDDAWAPAWSPDGTRIAFLRFDESLSTGPAAGHALMKLLVLDLERGTVTDVGVRVATDLNGPVWVSNDSLLVNRYD